MIAKMILRKVFSPLEPSSSYHHRQSLFVAFRIEMKIVARMSPLRLFISPPVCIAYSTGSSVGFLFGCEKNLPRSRSELLRFIFFFFLVRSRFFWINQLSPFSVSVRKTKTFCWMKMARKSSFRLIRLSQIESTLFESSFAWSLIRK